MALVHRAELRPTKLELLSGWLPGRPWYPASTAAGLERVASYRFDDPDGEVGVETMLVRAGGGPLVQIPLTYRGAPLPGADAWLVGACEHSVLGPRWVYDGCADPVYAQALATAILTGSGQAAQYIDIDGRLETLPASMSVTSAGTPAAAVHTITGITETLDQDPTVIVTDSL